MQLVVVEAGVDISFVRREVGPSVFEGACEACFFERGDIPGWEMDYSGVEVHYLFFGRMLGEIIVDVWILELEWYEGYCGIGVGDGEEHVGQFEGHSAS